MVGCGLGDGDRDVDCRCHRGETYWKMSKIQFSSIAGVASRYTCRQRLTSVKAHCRQSEQMTTQLGLIQNLP
jgi:hypothetical protein